MEPATSVRVRSYSCGEAAQYSTGTSEKQPWPLVAEWVLRVHVGKAKILGLNYRGWYTAT